MPKKSAGILFYRIKNNAPEFLLVHPGGPFWSKKDEGAWSISKGEFEEGEKAFDAALREVMEETGIEAKGNFIELEQIKQKGGKIIYAWALEMDSSPAVRSNTFEMEWPPKSGQKKTFPEIDKAEWFPLDEAKKMIIPAQSAFIDQLEKLLRQAGEHNPL